MAPVAPKATDRARWGGGCLGVLLALMLFLVGTAAAQDCPRKPRDPRSARLQLLDIKVAQNAILGRVKNASSDTALGVMVWVNYYISRGGGLIGQQCIQVGDLRSGEERGFQASPAPEVERAGGVDYTVDAVGWR